MSDHHVSRRDFVADSSRLAFGAMVVPRHVLGGPGHKAPSDTLNIAIVGMGGQGTQNSLELVGENIVAVCDVDLDFTAKQIGDQQKDNKGNPRENGVKLLEQFTRAAKYSDFREMLDKQKDIDAVVVATPDHLHATIAKSAMQMGKHVYVQKPLTYSVHEARVLRRTAQETGVVTQMGNQGHSSDDARLINEWVQAGVIGAVREVHVWTNRPIWPQGVPRPASEQMLADAQRRAFEQRAAQQLRSSASLQKPPAGAPQQRSQPFKYQPPEWDRRGVSDRLATAMWGDYKPSKNLHWDLYLGPVAEEIRYHPIYHPFNWRGWVSFGVGALGDMGAHLIDHPFWALGLTYPTSIEATSTTWGGPRDNPVSYPLSMTVHYQFPRRGLQPPVKLSWYDGGLYAPRPDALPDNIELLGEGGVIFVGERGILLHETYGRNPRIFPESLMEEAKAVPQTYPRIKEKHEINWVMACKGQGKATSPFEYAAQLTETMLLGIVALRTGQGKKLLYDGENMRVTNLPDANQYLTREYREGWAV